MPSAESGTQELRENSAGRVIFAVGSEPLPEFLISTLGFSALR